MPPFPSPSFNLILICSFCSVVLFQFFAQLGWFSFLFLCWSIGFKKIFSKSQSLYKGGGYSSKASGKMKKFGGNMTKYEGKVKKYEGKMKKYEKKNEEPWKENSWDGPQYGKGRRVSRQNSRLGKLTWRSEAGVHLRVVECSAQETPAFSKETSPVSIWSDLGRGEHQTKWDASQPNERVLETNIYLFL